MGQVETQAPHSMQASGSTTADAPSSIEIAETGHIPTHASHAIHLSLSTTAFDIRPNSSEFLIYNSYNQLFYTQSANLSSLPLFSSVMQYYKKCLIDNQQNDGKLEIHSIYCTRREFNYMEPRKPSLFLSIAVLSVVTALTIASFRDYLHMALIFGAIFASAIGVFILKNDYKKIEKGMVSGVMSAMSACLILFTVGPLVGMWIYTGVIPSMMYYGLAIVNPVLFLLLALVLSTVVAYATGTSWGTTGTIGVAFMGIAVGLGIPAPLTAGVILSGAYCGDKLSPNSDTTAVATSVTDVTVKGHIESMLWTTVPTYAIVILITVFFGFKYGISPEDIARTQAMRALLNAEFFISPVTFIAPALVIALTAMNKPALPCIWAGILVSVLFLFARDFDIHTIVDVLQYGYTSVPLRNILELSEDIPALYAALAESSIALPAEDIIAAANDLFNFIEKGGLFSMSWTISLVICAFVFGSVMESCGFIKTILEALTKPAKSIPAMITMTAISSLVCDVFLADQYLSISMPGKMFRPLYERKGLHLQTLSRTLEDSGTTLSALVPWNTCGAYQASVLNVATLEYLPFAFFNYLSPVIAILVAYAGTAVYWKGKSGDAYKGNNTPPFGTLLNR